MLSDVKSTAVQVFRLALENRVIDYNPAVSVKIPNNSPVYYRRALTDIEQQWINETPHRAQRAAMIMMYAGLRRGELIALTWNDINLKNKTITVNKSVEYNSNQPTIKQTKTKSGMRVVSIPDKLVEYLSTQTKDNIYVCTTSDGKILTETAWRRLWDSYLCDLNIKYGDFSNYVENKKIKNIPKSKYNPKGVPFVIPRITAHWLRHTFATMLYFAGVDILTAKEQLGHADIKTVLDIYTHLDNQYKKKSMSKLNDFLNNASQVQVTNSGNPHCIGIK